MEIFRLFGSIFVKDSASKELDKVKKKADETESKFSKLGGTFKKVGEGLTNVGKKLFTSVTLPILAAGGASFKLASDLSESMNKVDVAFKTNADEVKKWSKTTLQSYGMSQGSALDMASLFGEVA